MEGILIQKKLTLQAITKMPLKSLYLCRMFELESSLSFEIVRDFNIQILQQGRGEGRLDSNDSSWRNLIDKDFS